MEALRAQDPRQVGVYRLQGRLGSGGMGEVFLGESPGRRKVAVKLLKAELAQDSQFRQRFAREVAAAKMVGGFHTAQVVDADADGDPPWLVTAYIPGPSLATAVKQGGPLDPEAVRMLGAALAEGLAAIHACGLVHRDLKPGNIILAEDGPRIIDFGVARTEGTADLTSTGILVGTISFMSPEQVRGEHVDARSDVFSLGSVLAYAATGRSPFEASTMPAIASRIAAGPPELDGIGDPLRETIAACLCKDPAQRPTLATVTAHLTGTAREDTYVPVSAPAVAHAPETAASPPPWIPPSPVPEPPGTFTPPPGTAPSQPPRKRGTIAAVSVGAIVVAAAAGVLVALLPGHAAKGNQAGASGPSSPTPSATRAPATGTGTDSVPARYVGHWKGILRSDTGLEGPTTATLTLTKGKKGAVVGSASYPGVGCTYEFRLVSGRAGKVTLHEIVESGPCASEYVVLTPAPLTGLKDNVYLALPADGGTPTYTGHLYRGVS